MKLFSDYIKYYKLPNSTNFTFEEFCDINNINEDFISNNDIDYFYTVYTHYPKLSVKYETWLQGLEESLKSHDSSKLIQKIKDKLGDNIIDIEEMSSKNSNNYIIIHVSYKNKFVSDENENTNTLKNTKESHILYDILEFFNYYITLISYNYNGYWDIYIEPKYTNNITKQIKDNGGLIYHITDKSNLEKIKRTGIRPKVGKLPKDGGYRYFPERIYFIGNGKSKEETIQELNSVIKDKELNNYIIFEINISNLNIELWEDNISKQKNAIYTYTNIPPQLIKNIYTNTDEIN